MNVKDILKYNPSNEDVFHKFIKDLLQSNNYEDES